MNPNKCTFGVRSGKLLGFIASNKGIEVDPAKVKAIQEIPTPRTEKEVRGFLGSLNYIARFISHLTATCEPIFKLLKKDQEVKLIDECQVAFEKNQRILTRASCVDSTSRGKTVDHVSDCFRKLNGVCIGAA